MNNTFWVSFNDEIQGPFTFEVLAEMENAGQIVSTTYVRSTEEQAEWLEWKVLKTRAIIMSHAPVPELPKLSNPLSRLRPSLPSLEEPEVPDLDRGIYIFLAVFLGALGVHNFYARHFLAGAAQSILSIVGTLISLWNGLNMGLFLLCPTAVWIIFNIAAQTKDGAGRYMR